MADFEFESAFGEGRSEDVATEDNYVDYLQLPEPPVLVPPNTRQLGDFADNLQNLRNELQASEINEQKERLVDAYYAEIADVYKLTPTKIPYDQFSVDKDGKTLYWTPDGGRKIRISAVRALSGGVAFRALSSLAGDYGSGGTNAIRKSLELTNYTSKTPRGAPRKTLSAGSEKAVQRAANALPVSFENIELQDLAGVVNDTLASTETAETALDKEMTAEQSAALATLDDPPIDIAWVSQAKRELAGLGQAMTGKRDELTNNLAKLSSLDNEIAGLEEHLSQERRKLTETSDEGLQEEVQKRIRDLEHRLSDKQLERDARIEAASTIKEDLRGQLSRIRETLTRVLEGDKTLAERIRTLFREQGITIASVLTAIGMAISTLVLALTGGGSTVTPPAPTPTPPSDKGGIREWAKKTLQALGRALANLAGKAAAALPGIIGSIVSWLLSTLGKAASWLADHLWAIVLAVGGLLLMSAQEWLTKKPQRR